MWIYNIPACGQIVEYRFNRIGALMLKQRYAIMALLFATWLLWRREHVAARQSVGTAGDGERDVEYIHRPGNFESGGASGRPRDIAGDAGCHRKYQPVHVCRA